jgi:uncharacterized membrane protein (Fun14 family)
MTAYAHAVLVGLGIGALIGFAAGWVSGALYEASRYGRRSDGE